MLCIGLFGTCGNSNWRDTFIEEYNQLNIKFFNPQVTDWKPKLALIEAGHLLNDDIILFPVTNETFALGSLSETVFLIIQAINSNLHRSVVIMIEKDVSEQLKIENPSLANESIRTRALVLAHISKIKKSNVYIVSSLEEMLAVSKKLYQAHKILFDVHHLIEMNKINNKFKT